ncbi:SDR family NAD(P)-dependent oxidoreductase [Mucilaginibacter sp. P25]|uniref:SDR family NAD(P)-dependent oxidoreductase n=1 Tax=Mucilaginibacter sp. P25 TaxID=3423945 RepID=UPI003D7930D2
MNLGLDQKVAVVLAASKGLGKASAMALSAEGAKVIIGSRNAAELNEAAEDISSKTGNEVSCFPVDVSNSEQLTSFINGAGSIYGRIDILVNNAGGPPFGKFESFDDTQWQQAYEQNLLSFVRTSRLVLPFMKKAGSGRIINIVSGSVKSVLTNSVLSTAMRMGVVGTAKMLADEIRRLWNYRQ